jgi:hypothetical protein
MTALKPASPVLFQTLRRLFAVLALSTLASGCAYVDDLVPDKDMVGAPIAAVGHYGSKIGIPEFYLDGIPGGNNSGWGGGGKISCCHLLPRYPSKPVMVKVNWTTCDIGHMKFVNGRQVDLDDRCKREEHEATVPIHFEVEPDKGGVGLFVHFLPGHKVELWYPKIVGPGNPEYPGPAYPFGPAPPYAPVLDEKSQPASQSKK